jgi:hypothetical protein
VRFAEMGAGKCYDGPSLTTRMRIRRSVPIVLGVVLIAAAVTLIVQLRKHAPPEPARLLPGADAFLYLNLSRVRTLNAGGELVAVSHDPEYEQFIQETGFQFERDLDEAAFAVHYPPRTQDNAGQPRFSEVLVGKIQGDRLTAYLRKFAKSVDHYGPKDIYNVPLEGRTVRVAILGVDKVAISNSDDPTVIRGIVDRSRRLASPFRGPAFLRQYYKRVPIASLAWAIARVEPDRGFFAGGPALLFPKPAVLVVSARYIRAFHLKAEAVTADPDDAKVIAERASTFLNVFHAAESSLTNQGTDADVKAFFESLKVEQQRDRAVLTATVPPGFIRKVLSEAPSALKPTTPEPKPAPEPLPDAKAGASPTKRSNPGPQERR